MVATERYADVRLTTLTGHFREACIISDADQPAFNSALAKADRRSASTLAELVILTAALIWSGFSAHYSVLLSGGGWDGSVIAGESVLSSAGQVGRLFSTPLFLFLMMRWIWRFLVWAGLLYRISRLSLQLMPLHPDRSGGLGFLANFPSIFSGFIFALSFVVASEMIKEIGLEEQAAGIVWFAIAGWLVISVVLLLGHLLVFVKPLYALRERALIDYGRLASQQHLAFYRKWIAEGRSTDELMESEDISSLSDLNATVEIVRQLRYIPVDLYAVLQSVVAAGVPLLAVVLTQVPIGNLIKWIVGVIL